MFLFFLFLLHLPPPPPPPLPTSLCSRRETARGHRESRGEEAGRLKGGANREAKRKEDEETWAEESVRSWRSKAAEKRAKDGPVSDGGR